MFYSILKILPKNYLSYFFGKLMHLRLPYPLSLLSVKVFAKIFNIQMDSFEKPINAYPSIGDFFIRELKVGARKIEDGFVSPVDGTLRDFGKIIDGSIPQIKDINYTVKDFLGIEELADKFSKGYYFNFYLAPKDYHHVHACLECEVIESIYIPGALWPVNDWSLNTIKNLFVVNERLITVARTEYGLMAFVMVGATNVGKMTVVYDDWRTNNLSNTQSEKMQRRYYQSPYHIKKGDKLGTFHMGSTVVVLFDKATHLTFEQIKNNITMLPCKVLMGQRV
jgi:phosphatidylserine decarboxylase